jgi:hypothetical protein
MKTLNDLIPYYRHNRGIKDLSLFSPEESRFLINKGWNKDALEKFIRLIVNLSKELLMIPKFIMNYCKPDAEIDSIILDGAKGLPLPALSGLSAALMTNRKMLRRMVLRHMGFDTSATEVLELLISFPDNKIIELDFSRNPIKDQGAINILKAFK